jgi:hypothetical protein
VVTKTNDERYPLEEEATALLKEKNIEFATGHTWIRTGIRDPVNINDKPEGDVLDTFASMKDRALVIRDSRNIENDKATKNRLQWSDLTMASWKRACGTEAQPDTLKYIFRENIAGGTSAQRTQALIDAAVAKAEMDPVKVNVIRSGMVSGPLPAEITAFEILSGADHVNRVHRVMQDYPSTMKNLRIESLTMTTSCTTVADNEYNILITLAKNPNAET